MQTDLAVHESLYFFFILDFSSAIFGKLAKNDQIKIKRSNGEVHYATITMLDEEKSLVHVEVRFRLDRRSLILIEFYCLLLKIMLPF